MTLRQWKSGLRTGRREPRPFLALQCTALSPDIVPRRRRLLVADEDRQTTAHSRQIEIAESVIRIRDSTMIRTHRQIQIAACFVKHQRHPQRDKASGDPGVEIHGVVRSDIHAPAFMQRAEPPLRVH